MQLEILNRQSKLYKFISNQKIKIMATRSNIGKLNSDNTVTYIYCHWDGYPAHHGTILTEHYNTPEQVDALLALGDMSSLEDTLEACKPYNEPDCDAAIVNFNAYNSSWAIDYFYLFTDEGWKVSAYGNEWMMLEDTLQELQKHLQ